MHLELGQLDYRLHLCCQALVGQSWFHHGLLPVLFGLLKNFLQTYIPEDPTQVAAETQKQQPLLHRLRQPKVHQH